MMLMNEVSMHYQYLFRPLHIPTHEVERSMKVIELVLKNEMSML